MYYATNQFIKARQSNAKCVDVLHSENNWAKVGECIDVSSKVKEKYGYNQVFGYLISKYDPLDNIMPTVITPHIWNYDHDNKTHVDFISIDDYDREYVWDDIQSMMLKYEERWGCDVSCDVKGERISLGPAFIFKDNKYKAFISPNKDNSNPFKAKEKINNIPYTDMVNGMTNEDILVSWHAMVELRKETNEKNISN